MGRESQEPTHFDLLPTPAVGERTVRLWVLERLLREDVTVTLNTTLQRFVSDLGVPNDGACDAGYGLYQLTAAGARSNDGYLSYLFAKPKTGNGVLARLTPFREPKTKWIMKDWPAVMRSLFFVRGEYTDVVETPRIPRMPSPNQSSFDYDLSHVKRMTDDRMILYPSVTVSTEVIVREYLSNVPFEKVPVKSPIPRRVSYNFEGNRESIDCLGPEVRVPLMVKNGILVPDAGTPRAEESGWEFGTIFPASQPMQTWEPHIYAADDRFDDGVYYLTTYEALPPPLPPPLRF